MKTLQQTLNQLRNREQPSDLFEVLRAEPMRPCGCAECRRALRLGRPFTFSQQMTAHLLAKEDLEWRRSVRRWLPIGSF